MPPAAPRTRITVPPACEIAPPNPSYALKITAVYQDSASWDWVLQLCDRVIRIIGDPCLSGSLWRISDLTSPHVFPEAVGSAAQADVIVVAAQAARDAPLGLYAWIDAWLPRRSAREGALVALIGTPPPPGSGSVELKQYLQAVARRAQLDFLFQERCPAAQSLPDLGLSQVREGSGAAPPLLCRSRADRSTCCEGWGINE